MRLGGQQFLAPNGCTSARLVHPRMSMSSLCSLAGGNGEGQAASDGASSNGGWRWAIGGTHGGAVQAVDWHPSLPALLSSAADRSVHVTHVPPHALNP